MDLTYSSNKFEKQCTESKSMQKEFGQLSKGVERRMVELRTAETLGQLLSGPGTWHALDGDLAGCVAGRVSGNWRIIVEPEQMEDECTAVEVVSIVDYH